MTQQHGEKENWLFGLLIIAVAASVLAFASWDQALDFDPCDNIFKPPSQRCVTSAIEPIIVSALIAAFGGVLIRGALTRGQQVLSSFSQVLVLCWIGICVMLIAGAVVFAVLTTELPDEVPENDAQQVTEP